MAPRETSTPSITQVTDDRIFVVLDRLEDGISGINEKLSVHLQHCATTHGGVEQRIAVLASAVDRYAREHSKMSSDIDEGKARVYEIEKRLDVAAATLPAAKLQALENWKNAQEKADAARDSERRTERQIYGRLLPVIGALMGTGAAGWQIVQAMIGP